MDLDYDYSDADGNSKWVKQVRFKKKITKKDSSPAGSNEVTRGRCCEIPQYKQESISIDNSKSRLKRKKLIFKSKTKKHVLPLIKKEDVEKKSKSAKRLENDKFIRPANIIEFKKGDDGYGLLAFDESEIPDTFDSNSDSFLDSSSENCSTDENDGVNYQYSYHTYLKRWKDIENGMKYDFLPLPIDSVDLNIETVTAFIGSSKNLKQERIRWHPDRMKNILKRNGMLNTQNEHKVTQVFQVINEAFELFR